MTKVRIERVRWVGNQYGRWLKQELRVLSGRQKGKLIVEKIKIVARVRVGGRQR